MDKLPISTIRGDKQLFQDEIDYENGASKNKHPQLEGGELRV
jgi:hypothetical protein